MFWCTPKDNPGPPEGTWKIKQDGNDRWFVYKWSDWTPGLDGELQTRKWEWQCIKAFDTENEALDYIDHHKKAFVTLKEYEIPA